MATGLRNGGDELRVYNLAYLPRRTLCQVLDLDGKWEELAGVHMTFSYQDVQEMAKSKSPTNNLLERWGQKNHTVKELFILLSKMQHYRAMEILKPYVEERFHVLIRQGECNLTELLEKELQISKPGPQRHEAKTRVGQAADCKPAIDPCNINNSAPERTIRSKSVVVSGEGSGSESQETIDTSQVNINPQKAVTPKEGPTKPAAASSKADSTAVLKELVASFAALNVFHIELSELEIATGNWDPSCLLGRGGFGTVFRGTWKNTQVAIKRMELKGLDGADLIPLKQSTGELRILNSYRHDNILPLYGYSFKPGSNPCLVYQYMPNGSLEDRLLRRQGTAPLTWSQRLNIARGTARGLQFLHTTGEKPLIHGDIKSANILLDVNMEPKIGDFGLAREGPQAELTHMEVSRVHGTKPYLPSEYLRGRKISVKVDTYSYGIVLYELCTGLRAYDPGRSYQYLKDHVEAADDVLSLRDCQAPPEGSEVFFFLMNMGNQCAEQNARDRPEMVKVYQTLDAFFVPPSIPAQAALPTPILPAADRSQSSTYSADSQIPDISALLDDQSGAVSENPILPNLSNLGLRASGSSPDSEATPEPATKLNTREKSLPFF